VRKPTVVSAINDLKKRLMPLGVTIRNKRGVGYRLEELSNPPEPGKQKNQSRSKARKQSSSRDTGRKRTRSR
jgi:hypothetical protein